MRKRVCVTVLVMIYDGDKILLQNRINKKTSGLSFLSGHVEDDDSIFMTAIREVKEETNLNISNLRLAGIKEYYSGDNKYLSILVKTNKFEGELKSSEEGEVNWYTLDEIEQRDDLSEHFMATLKLFSDDDLSELIVLSDQQSVTI